MPIPGVCTTNDQNLLHVILQTLPKRTIAFTSKGTEMTKYFCNYASDINVFLNQAACRSDSLLYMVTLQTAFPGLLAPACLWSVAHGSLFRGNSINPIYTTIHLV